MKTTFKLLIILAVTTGIWSCKSFEGTSLTVAPNPLEVHGDSIEATVSVDVPANSGLKKDVTYVAQPEIGNYKDIQEIRVKSSEFPNANKEGIQASKTIKTPYVADAMQGKHLEIEHLYIKKNGKTESLPDLDNLAECCITTSQLYMLNTDFLFTDVEIREPEPIKAIAQFNFDLNEWRLKTEEKSQADVNTIGEFLKNNQDANIYINGYASPEGPFSRNQFLANKRTEVVKDFMKRELKAAGYQQFANEQFIENSTSEDWEGFADLVRNSAMSEQMKQDLIQIAQSTASPQLKEKMLKDVVDGGIHEIHEDLENVLAPLRRTTVTFEAQRKLKTSAEMDSIAILYGQGTITDMDLKNNLTQDEYLFLAQQRYIATGDRSLMDAYAAAYPDDYRLYNDMGIIALVDQPANNEINKTIGDTKIKMEGNEAKLKNDQMKIKVEGNESKIKTDDGTTIKVDGNEAKYENEKSELTVKMDEDDDELKIEDEANDVKIKIEGDEFKYKSGDMKVKVEGDEMKLKTDGMKYKYEGVNADAVALQYTREYDEALNQLMTAYKINQTDYSLLSNLGAVNVTKRNYTDAEMYLIKSLEAKETKEGNYNLGLVYALKGDYETAMTYFNKAGDNPKYLYNRGLTKLLMKDYAGAKSDLRTFSNAYPDEAHAYYLLAIAAARTNDMNAMTTNLQKACKMSEELCERAEDDLEFKDVRDNQAFKSAID